MATVWHSGSNYVFKEMRVNHNVYFQHTGPVFWGRFEAIKYNRLVTTLRDPYLVGASWANQYDMNGPEYRHHWHVIWAGWERLLAYDPEIRKVSEYTGAKVKSKGDPKGLHAMRDSFDMESYYKMMPKDLIEFAEDILKRNNLVH